MTLRSHAVRLLAAGAFLTPLTFASAQVPSYASPDSAVERLGRAIRILASAPRDVSALLSAGQAALDVGDPNAALGFFARAEDQAPQNAQVKAGLGAALVQLERADDALRLFAQASALGASDAAVARDRGLAYDLRGDTRAAQRDYVLALQRSRDDELVRRYALSLGIAGDRTGAMAALDPLLRRQDQGAWRARAFIMAMTGDVAGASRVAHQLMVPAMASAMEPLLQRLATLNAAERAHAVNFGTVPARGTQYAQVRTGDPYRSALSRSVGAIASPPRQYAPPPQTRQGEAVSAGSGLIPSGSAFGPSVTSSRPARVATVAPGTVSPIVNPTIIETVPIDDAIELSPSPSTDVAGAATAGASNRPADVATAPVPATVVPASVPTPTEASATAVTSDTPVARAVTTPTPAVPTQISPRPARLAGLLSDIETEAETVVELPDARALRLARTAARKKVAELAAKTAADAAETKAKAEEAAAAKRNPARRWVQVATGRNDSGVALTWRRIASANKDALKGMSGWSAPYKATNRILAGPVGSEAATRTLIKALAKNGVEATPYSSDAGEDIARIAK